MVVAMDQQWHYFVSEGSADRIVHVDDRRIDECQGSLGVVCQVAVGGFVAGWGL